METNVDVLVVGNGSNMLVADAGFDGIAVTLEDALADVSWAVGTGDNWVRAGGGRSFPEVARRAAAAGAGGLEWAVGIPGTVGGAVRMNAGGHGSDVATHLRTYTYVDLRGGPDGERTAADLAATYRHTSVRSAHVVTEATFNVEPVDPDVAAARSARSSGGGGRTSPAARTRGRCSRTPRATARDASSTPAG